jgi:hypothetical protein
MPSLFGFRSSSPVTSRLRYFLSIRFAAFQSISATDAAFRERHLLAQHAHIGLEALDIRAVFVHKVQMLNASIATSTSDLPFSEDSTSETMEFRIPDPPLTVAPNLGLKPGETLR